MSSAARVPRADASAAAGRALGTRVVGVGAHYVGTPYRYGGASPDEGFDCSGFVQYVFAREGVRLPRTARSMMRAGESVDVTTMRKGDLLLFATGGRTVDHIAIYAGGRRILHATASGGGVRYDELDGARGRWFLDRLVAARRVTAGGVGAALALADGDAELDPPDRAPVPR
jgi:cell wall-associated NlpC family hydrolase